MSQRRARNHCVIRTAFAKPRMGMPDVAICASDNAGDRWTPQCERRRRPQSQKTSDDRGAIF